MITALGIRGVNLGSGGQHSPSREKEGGGAFPEPRTRRTSGVRRSVRPFRIWLANQAQVEMLSGAPAVPVNWQVAVAAYRQHSYRSALKTEEQ